MLNCLLERSRFY